MVNKIIGRKRRADYWLPKADFCKFGMYAASECQTGAEALRAIVKEYLDAHPVAIKDKPEIVRTSVELNLEHYRQLKSKSDQEGIPISALLRTLIKNKLSTAEVRR